VPKILATQCTVTSACLKIQVTFLISEAQIFFLTLVQCKYSPKLVRNRQTQQINKIGHELQGVLCKELYRGPPVICDLFYLFVVFDGS